MLKNENPMTLLRNYFKKGWERSRERRKWRNRCLLSVLVVALGAYLYFKHQERVSPVLLSLKPFGCDHFTASGQNAHRDALGELNYSVQLRCEDAGSLLKASVSLIESARPLQLMNLMKQDLRGYLKGQRNAQTRCKTSCLRLPEELDETWLASLTFEESQVLKDPQAAIRQIRQAQIPGTQDTCFFLRRENRVIFVQLTGEDSLSESALKELLSLFDADFSFLDA